MAVHGRLNLNDLEEATNQRHRQRTIWRQWEDMSKTEQALFVAVGKASQTRRGDYQWVTRQQIARQLGKPLLVTHTIKLLEHLSGSRSRIDLETLHWIDKTKRPHFRQTYDGRRPAGYEWVYRPKADVIEALLEADPNKPAPVSSRQQTVTPAPKLTLWQRWNRAVDKLLGVG